MKGPASWLTIGVCALAVGLLADNLRLRAELEESANALNQRAPEGAAATMNTPKSSASKRRATPRRAAPPRADTTATPESEVEARIEQEVTARLSEAVDQKLDQDLNELVDQRVEERIEERRQERRDRMRAMMEERVAEYVEANDLDDETETRIVTIVEGSMSTLGDLFRSVQNGEMEREDVRDEMGAIRDDMEESLAEILGPEEAAVFQEDLRGPLGRRGPPR